jgi:transglutaminase/protease-like cytokinesis protein 3
MFWEKRKKFSSKRLLTICLSCLVVLAIVVLFLAYYTAARAASQIPVTPTGEELLALQPEGSLVAAVWKPGNTVQSVIEANSGEWANVLKQVYDLEEEITIPATAVQKLGAQGAVERCFEIISTYCYWINLEPEAEKGTLDYSGRQNPDGSITVSYGFAYYPDAVEIRRQFEEVAIAILTQTQGTTLSDQLLYFNKWLVNNVEYEKNSNMAAKRSSYSALVGKNSNCAGFTRAFLTLATAAGAESYYVSGRTGKVNHSWNMVIIDGKEYFFDVSWNISAISGDFYVFVNEERFARDHLDGVVYGSFLL